ncbi:methyltransferase domain-containing protein [Salinispora arenicola]|uniref:methyltransferase domain-containing protein n=1 Tax=Salinispora arenicola TaxID=168697 RepID=UPI00031FCDD1|nr:methyltransferase domain-containing protein [Salinispora arenicola]MCN0176808.1 methyltransferase domain-containing protein [Salinispora arenicola]NIL58935.1 methyltransferase domain-containing protein [Salinispora arenicola]NIL64404.1 methyltransferase domain-containing protein [Salinispora arenicola]
MSDRPQATPEVFDRRAEAWDAWQETPWGRLRYRLVAHTVDRAVRRLSATCRVLDAGGADGADSLRLAQRGHHVTIVDHAPALLARARARARAAGVDHLVRTVCAGVDEVPELRRTGEVGFDLVLCHNVLHYLPDTPAAVAGLATAVRPGGLISVLAPNPAMDLLAIAVRRSSPAEAFGLLDAEALFSETFEHDMLRLEAEDVAAALEKSGCTVTDRFGIRCATDLIANDELKHTPAFFADLERLELALCDREPYLRMARFWQLLATRVK